jgi:hypothetical protein
MDETQVMLLPSTIPSSLLVYDLLLTRTAPIKTIVFAIITRTHLELGTICENIPVAITNNNWIVSSGKDFKVACRSEYPSPVRTILSNLGDRISH